MTQAKALSCWLLAFALALGLAGCVTPTDAPPFDPRQVQASERALSQLDVSERLRQMPTTQEDPFGGEGDIEAGTTRPSDYSAGPTTGPILGSDGEPIITLSLHQCVQRTVVFNHDVRVAGYQPGIDATRITEAEALFDPTFFANTQFQVKDDQTGGSFVTNQTTGTTTTKPIFFNKSAVYEQQVGIKQNLTSGGQVQVDFDTTYNRTDPAAFVDNPFYTNKLELQLTQPLLRDFGQDVNEARIYIGRDNARVSLLDFRKALEKQIDEVEQTYWKLVDDSERVNVEEDVLKENEALYQLQYSRLRQHLVSSLEVSQVQTSLESRRATLIRAKANVREDSDSLKKLMSDPNLPISDPTLIVPADMPILEPMQFAVNDEINDGLENRFELGEDLLKIDVAAVTYKVGQNNTLPKLDFVGSVAPDATENDFAKTIREEEKFGHFEYSLGLQLEMPIGNREALAILRRTYEQRLQAIEQYSADVAQVTLDVRQAVREVDANYAIIITRRQSRLAAERALADERQRQEEGTDPLTPDYVQLRLQLADSVAEQAEAENDAIAEYNISLERLEFAKGTLLKYDNVVMQEDKYGDQGLLR